MNLNNFVFVKEDAFSSKFCDDIIQDFELYKNTGRARAGQSGVGINNTVKNTTDLNILDFPELKAKYNDELNNTFNYLLSEEYLGKIPFQEEFGKGMLFFNQTFYEILQVQKYDQNTGHYEGGETELLYTGLKVKPKKGQLLIHPASYPFVHKGHTPISDSKYILTTWLSYAPV